MDVPLSRRFQVSPYRIFGLCLMSVLDVVFGGGFVLSFRWFALGVGFGSSAFARLIESEKALGYFWFVSGVGFGRSVRRWFRLILSLVRLRCRFWTSRLRGGFALEYIWFAFWRWFWTSLLAAVSFYPSSVRLRCWFRTLS